MMRLVHASEHIKYLDNEELEKVKVSFYGSNDKCWKLDCDDIDALIEKKLEAIVSHIVVTWKDVKDVVCKARRATAGGLKQLKP